MVLGGESVDHNVAPQDIVLDGIQDEMEFEPAYNELILTLRELSVYTSVFGAAENVYVKDTTRTEFAFLHHAIRRRYVQQEKERVVESLAVLGMPTIRGMTSCRPVSFDGLGGKKLPVRMTANHVLKHCVYQHGQMFELANGVTARVYQTYILREETRMAATPPDPTRPRVPADKDGLDRNIVRVVTEKLRGSPPRIPPGTLMVSLSLTGDIDDAATTVEKTVGLLAPLVQWYQPSSMAGKAFIESPGHMR